VLSHSVSKLAIEAHTPRSVSITIALCGANAHFTEERVTVLLRERCALQVLAARPLPELPHHDEMRRNQV